MLRPDNTLPPFGLSYMNMDKAIRMMDPSAGEYLEAHNMRFYPDGILKSHDGMVEIIWDKPAGVNRPVGVAESRSLDGSKLNAAYILFHNSNGNHSVVAIWDDLTTDVIFQGPALEFDEDLGGCELLYEKAMVWDGPSSEPKCLDFERRADPDKLVKLTVFMPTSPDVVDQRTFAGTVLLDGVVQATSAGFYTATPAEVFSFTEMVRLFAAGFQAAFPQFTATGCGSWVELEATTAGDWTINITYTDIIATVVQPTRPVRWERLNTYAYPLNLWQVDLAKFSPVVAPEARLVSNPRKVGSTLDGHIYQFCHRYRFRDGSFSAEGLWSEAIPVSAQVCGLVATPNAIEYDFGSDPILNDPNAMAEVTEIDIIVSIDGTLWRTARTLLKWEWVYTKTWLFQNDVLLQPFQAVGEKFPRQPQTYVPLRANTLVQAMDPNDPATTRIVLGGIEEGYPQPCVQADLSVAYSDVDPDPASWCTVQLRIRVGDISVDDNYAAMQPVGKYGTEIVFGGMSSGNHVDTADGRQVLASGGFVAYVAGTPNYGISRQVIIIPNLPCGTIAPTIVPGSRNAFDLTQAGTSVSKCNRTHRAGYRVFVEDGGDVYQLVEIPVRSGRQSVIRLADHRCASGAPGIYDLNNTSLAWQGTSTNTVGLGYLGQPGTTQGVSECIVDIPAGYTGIWDAGFGLVLSTVSVHPPLSPTAPYYGVSLTFIDDDNEDYSPINDIRVSGTKAEKQIAYIDGFDALGQNVGGLFPNGNQIAAISAVYPVVAQIAAGLCPTDHNGHAFFSVGMDTFLNNQRYRAAWLSVTGDPLNPVGVIPNWQNGGGFTATNLTIVNGGNQNKWEGDLNTANPLTGPASGDLNFTGRVASYIVPNLGPTGCRDWIRTWLEGTVEDASGNPLPGMAVVVQRGRWTTTAADGSFAIPFYGDCFVGEVVGANFNNRETDGIYVASTTACTVAFTNGGYSGPYLVDNFEAGAAYSDGVRFPVGIIIGTIINASAATSTFPRGWTGRIGIKFYDTHGRQTPVQPFGKELMLAWKTQDLHTVDPIAYLPGTVRKGKPEITFTLNGPVPIPKYGRFISYQICCTRSTLYSERLDWVVPSAWYATEYVEGTGYTWTDYGSGSARILVLFMDEGFARFREINQQTALTDAAKEFIDLSGPGWTWQKGDRIQFASNSAGGTVFHDVELTGFRDGGLTLDASSIPFEVRGGEQVTIYRPSLKVPEASGILFYELPLASYEITDPFGSPSWSVSSALIEGGDHWALPTLIPIRPGNDPDPLATPVPWTSTILTRYSQSASDLFPSRVPSTGRAWASIPDASTDYHRSRFRWSNAWYNGAGLSATTFNGIPTFYEADFRDGPADAGAIMGSVFKSGVIVFMCNGGLSFAAYTGFVTTQAEGQQLYASSDGFITQVRPFAQEFGTNNPLSVRGWQTWAFAFDYKKAALFAYSVNGMDRKDVYGVQTFLDREIRKFDGLAPPRIVVGIDDLRNEVWLTVEARTLGPEVEIGGFTLIFTPTSLGTKDNAWIGFFDAAPQIYARQHNRLFSVLNGNIWLHDADPAHPNRFYGVDQAAVIKMAIAMRGQFGMPIQHHWLSFISMGMIGTAEFDDSDGEPNRVPAGRVSFSTVDKLNHQGYAPPRGIPHSAFGPLKSYALSIRLVGAPGQHHRILGYQVRAVPRV